ncbi:MAG TPA: bacteriocin [Ktedonobacterales bacterium]|jgi:bacteriocin-like protein
MKKTNKTQKGKKPSGHVPMNPKDVTELTDQDLQQIQGGQGLYIPEDRKRIEGWK